MIKLVRMSNLNETIEDFKKPRLSEALEKCCICGKPIEGYGNNAEPVKKGKCCDECNISVVIPARLTHINEELESGESGTEVEEIIAPVYPEPTEEDIKFAYSDRINSLTQSYWNIINEIKSIKASLEVEKTTSFDKGDIEALLNTLSDEATISVGVLAKASELIDSSTSDLMNAGIEKAEEVISEPASKDLE